NFLGASGPGEVGTAGYVVSRIAEIGRRYGAKVVEVLADFGESAPTAIHPLSLHDALPISPSLRSAPDRAPRLCSNRPAVSATLRSEEHTSELQSRENLVCRLLLEKKNSPASARCCRTRRARSSGVSFVLTWLAANPGAVCW